VAEDEVAATLIVIAHLLRQRLMCVHPALRGRSIR